MSYQKQKVIQVTGGEFEAVEAVSIVSGKIPGIGLSLEEILGVGLGVNTNTSLMDVGEWVIKICGGNDPQIYLIEKINNVEGIANTNIAGLIERAEHIPFEQSKFYKDIVSNMEAALVPYAKAITFDLVNLGGDVALVVVSKGKYRKAFLIKAGVDLGLLAKDVALRQYVINHSKEIIMSVARPESNPYPSVQEAIKAVYYMKDQQLIPFLQYMKQIGKWQLPINVIISFGVGAALLVWVYKSTKKEKIKINEYATDIV